MFELRELERVGERGRRGSGERFAAYVLFNCSQIRAGLYALLKR